MTRSHHPTKPQIAATLAFLASFGVVLALAWWIVIEAVGAVVVWIWRVVG